MKKLISVLLVCLMLIMSVGCANSKNINPIGKVKPYGLLNQDTKVEHVEYSVSWGNVIWGCLLLETIVAPICLFGFYLFEPESMKE